MPTKSKTQEAAIKIFQSARYPEGKPTYQTAWVGFYQVLLWYEAVSDLPGRTGLPHIIDANELRKRGTEKGRPGNWQKRAIAMEACTARHLRIEASQLASIVDRLMKLPLYKGLQRNNPLGIAFTGLLKYVLECMGNHRLTYELEVQGDNAFPGVQIPTRTKKPSIDMLVRKEGRNVGIISTKWSIRHDRYAASIHA